MFSQSFTEQANYKISFVRVVFSEKLLVMLICGMLACATFVADSKVAGRGAFNCIAESAG
jgi:hypothetical protein